MAERELFITRDMGEGILCIEDATNVFMYLVKGTHHALLIDVGTGAGNLFEFVQSLTELPLYVAVTHGHVDHAGGCYDFREIYLPEEDRGLLEETTTVQLRREYADKTYQMARTMGLQLPDRGKESFTPPGEIKILNLKSGMEFDLGGRTVTAVPIHGHTRGFTGFYDDRSQTLFAGDGGNPSTFLFFKESTTLGEYYQSLLELKEKWEPRTKRWLISHLMPEVSVSILEELIDCCETVFQGKSQGTHFHFDFADMANDNAFFAYPAGEDQMRVDGKSGNIVYDKNRI